MVRQINQYLIPWSEAYGGKPIFLPDVQCLAVRGAAIWPTRSSGRPIENEQLFAPEEQLNWFAAILRGMAIANRQRDEPLFLGLSMGYYGVMPDQWLEPASERYKEPYVNDANNRRDLPLFMKTHYADKPFVTSSPWSETA